MHALVADLRFALRYVRRTPAFAIVAVVSLALGIGANLTIFTFVNSLLLQSMPAVRPAELVDVFERGVTTDRSPLAYPDYRRYRRAAAGRLALAAYQIGNFALGTDARTELRIGLFVSDNYPRVMGMHALAGRLPIADSTERAFVPEVMLGATYAARFAGAPERAIGRTIFVNGHPLTVVGVAAREFQPILGASVDVITPLANRPTLEPMTGILDQEGLVTLSVLGRLSPGLDRAGAQRLLNGAARAIDASHPRTGRNQTSARKISLFRAGVLPAGGRTPVAVTALLLFLLTALVLFLACTNLANLLLARAVERRRELAVRAALGASRRRVVQQLLAEGLVLASLAGALGILVGRAWTEALMRLLPLTPVPLLVDVTPGPRLIVATGCLAVAATLLFALVPALEASRVTLTDAMRDATAGAGTGHRQTRRRRHLVALQMAMTTVLLVVAGLFVRSLVRAQSIDPGFSTREALLATVDVSRRFPRPDDGARFFERVLARLASTEGVRSVAIAQTVPLDLLGSGMTFRVEDGTAGGAEYDVVGHGFFATMGLPLRAGRDFSTQPGATGEIIVNEAMVGRHFPSGSPIGRRIRLPGSTQWLEVVGVVANAKYSALREPAEPYFFLSAHQRYRGEMTLIIGTSGNPKRLIPTLREIVDGEDPSLPLYMVRTLREHAASALFLPRIAGVLLGTLGLITLLLAILGVYGIMSYSTSMRQTEIGVRLALGADRRSVVRLVVRQGLQPVVVGTVAGLLLAVLASHAASAYLFGLSPSDAVTYVSVIALVGVVATVSCLVPARRISRTEPASALREG